MKTRTRKVRGNEVTEGYCARGDHWLPFNDDNFYFKGSGAQRYAYVGTCRPHERAKSNEVHKALRERRKAEKVEVVATPRKRTRAKNIVAKKTTARRARS